ncbi:uncharacterized protein LOC6583025 [Drosophila mojavensis]|uniref:Uncharacterized protein n=1 Tax=Drosophila mojavensis TaxID=7230 RepID=B4L0T0_DROMO|nr:uncharacterized protein LOC6583025 [Drosophila mojavensis]EDW19180.2 uncharacterized protein Dmoj_GI13645 [Drosophila mojavensis]
MHMFWIALLLFASTNEIRAREAMRPAEEVGQIIKDLVGANGAAEEGAACILDIQMDLPHSKQQPLYLHPDTDTYWLPNKEGKLEIPTNENIELYCENSFSIGDSIEHGSSLRVRCLNDNIFQWNGQKWELEDFTCSTPLIYTVEQMNQPCGDGDDLSPARLYRVGYNISEGRFVRTIDLCHDANQLQTLYASYQLIPANSLFQRGVKRIKFSAAGHFSGYDMNTLYSQKRQLRRVAELFQRLNATENGSSFLAKGQYLTRGHLAAKADFIYASQQRTTFNYMNVAPQWQIFNGGPWQIIEDKIRELVSRLDLSVSVYTGTYGVMPLSKQTAFHLANNANGNGSGVLPVPLLYYRLLIDNQNPSRGLAIMGVNNPHATQSEIEESYIICPRVEVPSLHSWLQAKDLRKAYLYACRVADLAMAVGHLPPQLQDVNELIEES